MKTSHLKIILAAIFIGSTLGCATLSTYHSLTYSLTDNQNIALLAWDYSDRRRASFSSNQMGLGNFSHGFYSVGDEIKIKWLDKTNNQTKLKTITLKQHMPFNMNGAQIRISFNQNNDPEIYVFHESPFATKYFTFRGNVYTNKRVKMISPKVKNIEIKQNESIK